MTCDLKVVTWRSLQPRLPVRDGWPAEGRHPSGGSGLPAAQEGRARPRVHGAAAAGRPGGLGVHGGAGPLRASVGRPEPTGGAHRLPRETLQVPHTRKVSKPVQDTITDLVDVLLK